MLDCLHDAFRKQVHQLKADIIREINERQRSELHVEAGVEKESKLRWVPASILYRFKYGHLIFFHRYQQILYKT